MQHQHQHHQQPTIVPSALCKSLQRVWAMPVQRTSNGIITEARKPVTSRFFTAKPAEPTTAMHPSCQESECRCDGYPMSRLEREKFRTKAGKVCKYSLFFKYPRGRPRLNKKKNPGSARYSTPMGRVRFHTEHPEREGDDLQGRRPSCGRVPKIRLASPPTHCPRWS